MSAYAINKQAFEFTCKTEDIARNVRREIEYYTASQINDIISSILSEYTEADSLYKIDQIEIDLGDVALKDFGKTDMLDKFKEIFRAKITSINNDRNYFYYKNVEENTKPEAQIDSELEMIRSFILRGDIPWWADKNSDINFDAILQKLITVHPQSVKLFLEQHKERLEVLLRILERYKPKTISMIDTLIPGIIPIQISKKFFQESDNDISAFLFSHEHLVKLKSILYEHTHVSVDRLRKTLLRGLIRLNNLLQLKNKSFTITFPGNKFLALGSLRISDDKTDRNAKKDIWVFIKKLSVFQIEFLLLQLSLFFDAGSKIETKKEDEEVIFEKIDQRQSGNINFLGTGQFVYNELNTINSGTTGQWIKNENLQLTNTAKPFLSNNPENKTDQTDDIRVAPGINDNSKREVNQKTLVPETENGKQTASNTDTTTTNTNNKLQEGGQSILSDSENPKAPIDLNTVIVSKEVNRDQMDKIKEPLFYNTKTSKEDTAPEDNKQQSDFISPQKGKYEKNRMLSDNNEHARNRKIAFIMKKLNTADSILLHYLKQLDEQDIDNLLESFKKHIHRKIELRKMIADLLEHPYLLKYNLLKIYANLSFDKEDKEKNAFDHPNKNVVNKKEIVLDDSNKKMINKKETVVAALAKKIQLSQSAFFSLVNKLSLKELVILKDIFQKGRFYTNNGKKIIRKVLLNLPDESILLVKFLTELPEKELEYLSLFNNKIPPIYHRIENKESNIFYNDIQYEKIYIENAGLCLIAVYLQRLFNHLGYLEDKFFKNKASATRALYLLQYIVTGKNKSLEHLLQLNKLLCGIQVEDYITASLRLTKKEMEAADDFIQSVIENWKTLKNTSIQGFRESFLQRKGILFENEVSWTMQVERKGFDLLLNTIPWGFSALKLPWMKKYIQVEW